MSQYTPTGCRIASDKLVGDDTNITRCIAVSLPFVVLAAIAAVRKSPVITTECLGCLLGLRRLAVLFWPFRSNLLYSMGWLETTAAATVNVLLPNGNPPIRRSSLRHPASSFGPRCSRLSAAACV